MTKMRTKISPPLSTTSWIRHLSSPTFSDRAFLYRCYMEHSLLSAWPGRWLSYYPESRESNLPVWTSKRLPANNFGEVLKGGAWNWSHIEALRRVIRVVHTGDDLWAWQFWKNFLDSASPVPLPASMANIKLHTGCLPGWLESNALENGSQGVTQWC